MSNEFDLRFNDIRSGPWRTRSILARSQIVSLQDEQAKLYVRSHHSQGGPRRTSDEIKFRESFDQALDELQLVELALSCGYLPLDFVKAEIVADLAELLGRPIFHQYLKTYDFIQVRFLAARVGFALDLEPVIPPPADPSMAITFASLLAVHSEFVDDQDVRQFTRLLDDYRFCQYVDASFLKAYLAGVTQPSVEKPCPELTELVVGAVRFAEILGDFFFTLTTEKRGLFGCFYAYWLSRFFGEFRTPSVYQVAGCSFGDSELRAKFLTEGMGALSVEAEQRRYKQHIEILRQTWGDAKRALAAQADFIEPEQDDGTAVT